MFFNTTKDPQELLTEITGNLKALLGANLHTCLAFGSVVRGNFNPKTSDINLLIVLTEPSVAAYQAIAGVIQQFGKIEPFLLERRGMERTMRVFAVKFKSIQRNYRLLAGEDPFTGYKVPDSLSKLLCEQAIRNLRLRLTHDFVKIGEKRIPMSHRLHSAATSVFVDMSEMVRLQGVAVPNPWPERVPVISKTLDIPETLLNEILEVKAKPRSFSSEEIIKYYGDMLNVLTHCVRWMEARWELA